MYGIFRAVFVLSVAFAAAIYMNAPDGGSVKTVLSNTITAVSDWDKSPSKSALGVPAPVGAQGDLAEQPENVTFTLAGAPAKATENDAYIAASLLNLRAGPSTDFAVLEKLPFAEKVTVVSRNTYWVQVEGLKDGQAVTGWVNKRYLSQTPPTVRIVSKSKPKRNRKATPPKRRKTVNSAKPVNKEQTIQQ
ncbi:SH3 domain-containing protein [Amylibacter sp. IMCC11727]|uniref:SH3 domain-containing protein n=1 Tax=Amylibacter sp. IMCC11727 TaxID=3039851 RepID=UPI00244E3F0F|nr:SH3 domain-containing protein [Amylibacter sp. IMCC11727]WGI22964.1 SH3 domain-containing protein [Amylibacter sp. IMCC11727]